MGAESEAVKDTLATLRQRLGSPRIVITPTAKLELIHIARQDDTAEDRNLALKAVAAARQAGIVPVNLLPVGHGIVKRVAEALRAAGLIPAPEVNDSQLVVEAALMGARLLLSGDEHLRGVDFERLTIELQNSIEPRRSSPRRARLCEVFFAVMRFQASLHQPWRTVETALKIMPSPGLQPPSPIRWARDKEGFHVPRASKKFRDRIGRTDIRKTRISQWSFPLRGRGLR